MKRFASILFLLFFLTLLSASPTLAQSSGSSGTAASSGPTCEGLARACSAAADELKAARALIAGYERERAATDARLAEANKQLALETKRAEANSARADALTDQVIAETKARIAVEQLAEDRGKEIGSLKAKLGRSRKIGAVVAVAAFILGATR